MARATGGVARHRKKKRYLRAARGYFGGRSKLWRIAKNAVERGWVYSYRDRKQKKREFRRLWITRINAAVRENDDDMNYSRFMNGLKRAGIEVNRKVLADLAVHDQEAFARIAELAKACKAGGVWPFTHFNRLHVVPPCNTSVDDVRLGLGIIDDALAAADAYCS